MICDQSRLHRQIFSTTPLNKMHVQASFAIAIYKQTRKWVSVNEDLPWQPTEILRAHFLFFQTHTPDPNSGVLTK